MPIRLSVAHNDHRVGDQLAEVELAPVALRPEINQSIPHHVAKSSS
jgi:hypothetical protein